MSGDKRKNTVLGVPKTEQDRIALEIFKKEFSGQRTERPVKHSPPTEEPSQPPLAPVDNADVYIQKAKDIVNEHKRLLAMKKARDYVDLVKRELDKSKQQSEEKKSLWQKTKDFVNYIFSPKGSQDIQEAQTEHLFKPVGEFLGEKAKELFVPPPSPYGHLPSEMREGLSIRDDVKNIYEGLKSRYSKIKNNLLKQHKLNDLEGIGKAGFQVIGHGIMGGIEALFSPLTLAMEMGNRNPITRPFTKTAELGFTMLHKIGEGAMGLAIEGAKQVGADIDEETDSLLKELAGVTATFVIPYAVTKGIKINKIKNLEELKNYSTPERITILSETIDKIKNKEVEPVVEKGEVVYKPVETTKKGRKSKKQQKEAVSLKQTEEIPPTPTQAPSITEQVVEKVSKRTKKKKQETEQKTVPERTAELTEELPSPTKELLKEKMTALQKEKAELQGLLNKRAGKKNKETLWERVKEVEKEYKQIETQYKEVVAKEKKIKQEIKAQNKGKVKNPLIKKVTRTPEEKKSYILEQVEIRINELKADLKDKPGDDAILKELKLLYNIRRTVPKTIEADKLKKYEKSFEKIEAKRQEVFSQSKAKESPVNPVIEKTEPPVSETPAVIEPTTKPVPPKRGRQKKQQTEEVVQEQTVKPVLREQFLDKGQKQAEIPVTKGKKKNPNDLTNKQANSIRRELLEELRLARGRILPDTIGEPLTKQQQRQIKKIQKIEEDIKKANNKELLEFKKEFDKAKQNRLKKAEQRLQKLIKEEQRLKEQKTKLSNKYFNPKTKPSNLPSIEKKYYKTKEQIEEVIREQELIKEKHTELENKYWREPEKTPIERDVESAKSKLAETEAKIKEIELEMMQEEISPSKIRALSEKKSVLEERAEILKEEIDVLENYTGSNPVLEQLWKEMGSYTYIETKNGNFRVRISDHSGIKQIEHGQPDLSIVVTDVNPTAIKFPLHRRMQNEYIIPTSVDAGTIKRFIHHKAREFAGEKVFDYKMLEMEKYKRVDPLQQHMGSIADLSPHAKVKAISKLTRQTEGSVRLMLNKLMGEYHLTDKLYEVVTNLERNAQRVSPVAAMYLKKTFDSFKEKIGRMIVYAGRGGKNMLDLMNKGTDIIQTLYNETSPYITKVKDLWEQISTVEKRTEAFEVIRSHFQGNPIREMTAVEKSIFDNMKMFYDHYYRAITAKRLEIINNLKEARRKVVENPTEQNVYNYTVAERIYKTNPFNTIEGYITEIFTPNTLLYFVDEAGFLVKQLREAKLPLNTKMVSEKSGFLKKKENLVQQASSNIPANMTTYMVSMAKNLAYFDLMNYVKYHLQRDMIPIDKKHLPLFRNTLADLLQETIHPTKTISENKFIRKFRNMVYYSLLGWNLKGSAQNLGQSHLLRLYISDEAMSMKRQFRNAIATDRIAEALRDIAVTQDIVRKHLGGEDYLSAVYLEKKRPIIEKIKATDTFRLSEKYNWARGGIGGLISAIIDSPIWRPVWEQHIANGLNKWQALNEVLKNQKAYEHAVSFARDLNKKVNVSLDPFYKPEFFDNKAIATMMMFLRFPITVTELIGKSLKRYEGAFGLRSIELIRRGELPEPALLLKEVEGTRRTLQDMVKNQKITKGKDELNKYINYLKQIEKDLQREINILTETTISKGKTGKALAKFIGHSLTVSLLWQYYRYNARDMMDELYGGVQDEEKRMQDMFLNAFFDAIPTPMYQMNPSNFLNTVLLPDINIMNYGRFTPKLAAKNIMSFGFNLAPGFSWVNRMTGSKLSDEIMNKVFPPERRQKTRTEVKIERELKELTKDLTSQPSKERLQRYQELKDMLKLYNNRGTKTPDGIIQFDEKGNYKMIDKETIKKQGLYIP